MSVTLNSTVLKYKNNQNQFQGIQCMKGDTYELTAADKVEIAGIIGGIINETISDTNPVIVGVANHRYVCGEVQTISITPPASGIIDVIFTSGSTAAILTLPNTVKMPAWFDSSALETGLTYEINIADGVYGAVMSWQS